MKSGGREAKTHRDKIFPTPEGGQILTLGVPFHPFWKNINSYAVRYRDDSGSVNPWRFTCRKHRQLIQVAESSAREEVSRWLKSFKMTLLMYFTITSLVVRYHKYLGPFPLKKQGLQLHKLSMFGTLSSSGFCENAERPVATNSHNALVTIINRQSRNYT